MPNTNEISLNNNYDKVVIVGMIVIFICRFKLMVVMVNNVGQCVYKSFYLILVFLSYFTKYLDDKVFMDIVRYYLYYSG